MHLEIRKRGVRKKYYLAHSFREKKTVRKIRKYLGEDLSQEELSLKRRKAEVYIQEQLKIYRQIRDPLKAVLSEKELVLLKKLKPEGILKIAHLSEKDWLAFIERFTYDTNAIEGSTVGLNEVRDILEDKGWPAHTQKWEISETYGVADAVQYIRETKTPFSIGLMKKLHELVFKNSKSFAGRFRGRGVEVVIRDGVGHIVHRGAPSVKVLPLLKELINWYAKNKRRYPPLLLAAVVHNQFENIHPFQDGNGRVGRLLLNTILLRHGLPPVNIEFKNRQEYYAALQFYENEGNIRPTLELLLREYKQLKKQLRR